MKAWWSNNMKVNIKFIKKNQEFLDCKGVCVFTRSKAKEDIFLVSLPNMSVAIPKHIFKNISDKGSPWDEVQKDLEGFPQVEDGWLFSFKKEDSK